MGRITKRKKKNGMGFNPKNVLQKLLRLPNSTFSTSPTKFSLTFLPFFSEIFSLNRLSVIFFSSNKDSLFQLFCCFLNFKTDSNCFFATLTPLAKSFGIIFGFR